MENQDKDILQEEIKGLVRSTGKWYRFFGIMGIISLVFMVILAMVFMVAGEIGSEIMDDLDLDVPGGIFGFLYLCMAGLMVPVVIYLMKGASAASEVADGGDSEALVSFLRNTKRFWKYYGILTISIMGLYLVIVLIVAIAAFFAAL